MDVDLYTLVREDILAERHRKFIFYQIAKALYYLHSAGLIHRDLKPSNVLVNENCEAKLCDFGLVRSLEDGPEDPQDILTEYIATRWYRAPEILVGSRKYSRAIDIWSMGCMLAEMQRGKPLFAGTSTINQLEKVLSWTGPPSEQEIKSLKLTTGQEVFKLLGKVKKGNRKEMVPNASDDCLDLIAKMLDFDPDKRIDIEEILMHPYLSEFYQKN
jgi:mitogen-activated protein kinase 15